MNYSALKAALPDAALTWLSIGGMAYTIGIIFYVLDKMKKMQHAHGIWHVFVLCGSICHFISISVYVR